MENDSKLHGILKVLYISMILILMLFVLSTSTVNINYAKILYEPDKFTLNKEKEFPYTFQVSDKLTGKGQMFIFFEDNNIKGKALGLGMTCQCNIDFTTNIQGKLSNMKEGITIDVSGIGDPAGILPPGKVTFAGPLKGYIENEKLKLKGVVNIKGNLAHYAGFKDTEEIIIEIPDPSLARTCRQIQSQHKLAFL